MNFRSISLPSVVERYNQPLINVSSDPEKCIQLYEAGAGYLIGDLALKQGYAPYRNINSSPSESDYQLLAKAGLLIASGAKSGEVVITTGFPYATYELYKQQAVDFFTSRDVFIEFNADTYTTNEHKRIQLSVKHVEVMPEILGCIMAIRKGLEHQGNFFVVSLGYGTCETALSMDTGLVTRTCMSASGLRYAVNNLHAELSKSYNLGMKNEHMVNQSFQSGKIVLDRKKKDITDLRRNHLANYYDEVLSPTLKKEFIDIDFENTDTLYLVGGGAKYTDLVDCFKQEFDGIADIVVPEQAENMASIGYCIRSAKWCGPGLATQAVGLDIGNAYTVVSQVKTEAEKQVEEAFPENEGMLNYAG
jgi:plasmid segregation protein ParM